MTHWFFVRRQADAIMLVEPGMLLIYRSADKHPRMTDMLVEYLYDYASGYDPGRVQEAFLSLQKVFIPMHSYITSLRFCLNAKVAQTSISSFDLNLSQRIFDY